ncbi:MAG: NAD(P)/FAD-dependent oxidoreductase, partial [Chloroflexi bacterium]|nr:NAD(P)/FAD-dependent oxidoreductase [Chloroflexota bacterium]
AICYMVMRDRFDNFLTDKAREAGVEVIDGARVDGVSMDGDGCTVRLAEGTVRCRVLVGADGANSIVAQSLGLMRDADLDLALEAEVKVTSEVQEHWAATVALDLGMVKGGYGWVFPKGDHLSVGVAGQKRYTPQLQQYYHDYLSSLHLGAHEVVSFRGHHIPLRHDTSPIVKGRALLVGDAAGLADPFSGEGIHHAIKSALFAAPVVADYLEGKAQDLSAYQRRVDREIMPDLRASARFLRAFSAAPAIFMRITERLQRPFDAGCRMVRGEITWSHIMDRTGPFRLVLRFMD